MHRFNYNKDLKDLPNEKWKDVIGYDGYYQISNMGRLKSLPRQFFTAKGVECISKEKIKSLRFPKKGSTNVFCEYSLDGVNKRYNFAKQIALHFIKGYKYGDAIYFIDGDRNNCKLDNIIHVTEKNVIKLYDKKTIIPPNNVSEMLHKMGYKKCCVCKKIKPLNNFSKANRNRDTNNNCQKCVTRLCYEYRNEA